MMQQGYFGVCYVDLTEFGIFDIMMRASILLGIAIMAFSNIITIRNNRKMNEKMQVIKYYNSFLVQQIPLYSTYFTSLLIGLGLFRVGSILKVDMASRPVLGIGQLVFIQSDEILKYQTLVMIACSIGALLFVVFCIVVNVAQIQLAKNYSLFVDIKENYHLKRDELYSFVRHPLYLFEILSYLAAALALLSWMLLLWVVLVHIPLYLYRAKAEDELLEHYYGDSFRQYKSKVGGFLPGMR